jgi:hypothetical protein
MSVLGALRGLAVGLFGKKSVQTTPVPVALPINISGFHDSLGGRAEAATAALATLAQAGDVGRPFGPGFGLEEARAWLLQIFKNQSELQATGHVAGDILIAAIRARRIDLKSVSKVLGIDEVAARRFDLSKRQHIALMDFSSAAQTVLLNMAKEDLVGLKKWFSDMSFMAEILAYHQLAVLRLRVAGLLDQ